MNKSVKTLIINSHCCITLPFQIIFLAAEKYTNIPRNRSRSGYDPVASFEFTTARFDFPGFTLMNVANVEQKCAFSEAARVSRNSGVIQVVFSK